MINRRAIPCLVGAIVGIFGGAPGTAAPPLTDVKHVSWSTDDGAPNRINAITQSADGFLWIGGVQGLFRFDGVTFEPVRSDRADGGSMVVAELLGTKAGDVWVGLARGGGVSIYRGGRLIDSHMPNPSREVTGLAEDPAGGMWAARGGRTRNTLARFWRGRWQEQDANWNLPAQQVWQVMFTRDGAMWVVLSNAIVRRLPGKKAFEVVSPVAGRRASIAEDAVGRLWLADLRGTRLLQANRVRATASAMSTDPQAQDVGGNRLLFGRQGDLWAATWTAGIFRASAAKLTGLRRSIEGAEIAARFTEVEGLTSDQTHALFEDREGNVWIGTELGIDMLRRADMVVEPAIPSNSPRGYRMARTRAGTIYVSDSDKLYRTAPGQAPRVVLRTASTAGSLCAGRDADAVWVALRRTMLHVRSDRVVTIDKPGAISSYGCAEDARGRLWLAALDDGLYWHEGGRWRRRSGLSSAGLPANAAVDATGRAAILFRGKPDAHPPLPFTVLYRDRFAIGGLEGVLPGRAALYLGGAKGLARLDGERARALSATTYPWLASVNGLAQTAAGETWTIGDAGIVRMATAQLDRAFTTPGARLAHQLFDFRDGLNSFAQKGPGMQAAVGGDGRLWFLTRRNVIRIDPTRLTRNPLPPPVTIRAVVAGERRYANASAVTVPAGTRTLRIDYTALSLSVPGRVRFRYRLEGVDAGWIDAGTRREALYGDLSPGNYRFRVIAANNDGVWNRTGATIGLTIPPTFVQTWAFRILCVVGGLLLLWLLYSLRLRQVGERMRAALEHRIAERERIARELHDTLLQGVQGLVMRFQSVAGHIPEGHPAQAAIDGALERADQILIEARDRVRDLRMPDSRNLEAILVGVAREQPFAASTTVEIVSDGTPRAVQPVVLDEVVRIAGEALFNAALHAQARQVRVSVVYDWRWLKVVFRDDGVGIGAERLILAGHAGHFGLIGMHERARRIGAQLSLHSPESGGATITVRVAASVAYIATARRWRLFGTLRD